jgi:hypothetical protein
MKFRNWDWPLLNSPLLSLGATQLVILSAACLSSAPLCAYFSVSSLTIFATVLDEKKALEIVFGD